MDFNKTKESPFWEDKLTNVPLYRDFIKNYEQIREEVLSFIDRPGAMFDYPKYQIYGKDRETIIPLYENTWKAIPFSKFIGEYITTDGDNMTSQYVNQIVQYTKQNCPTLNSVIESLEGQNLLANGFISKLLPGSIINPHTGRTNMFMRMHLGLDCDPKCVLTVGNEQRVWEDGKIIAFKDGGPFKHSVKHEGSKQRIIISVDVDLMYLRQFIEE